MDHVRATSPVECGKTICYYFQDNAKTVLKLKKDYSEKFSKITGI